MNNDKYKILIIMGKSGAGKDTLARALTQALLESEMIVSCTTRPIRDNEQNGVDYHFLTHDEFAEQINNGEMIEATIFNDWCYGTSINNLSKDKLNIGVYNPQGVELLQSLDNIDTYVIYLNVKDKIRLLRCLEREEEPWVDEIIRRYGTDKEDFAEIDEMVKNGNSQGSIKIDLVLSNNYASMDDLVNITKDFLPEDWLNLKGNS